jgi:D-glycero-D-manno-heptose 1,7-bisphosphate phosphatase
MRRAVFLDRDGVLVGARPVGATAHGPLSLDEFRILPGIAEPLARLREAGYLLVLVTNQPGVARGQLPWDVLHEMHRRLREVAALDDVRVCPHTDADACACRKPKAGMLLDAARDLEIDLAQSFFIGDTGRDAQAGEAAGVRTILLDYEYNRGVSGVLRVGSLAEAADLILGRNQRAAGPSNETSTRW